LGSLGISHPKGEKQRQGAICTITQNLTPIGGTVAEISDLEQKKNRLTPDSNNNNNNNNNIQDNVYGAVIMAEPLQEFIRFI